MYHRTLLRLLFPVRMQKKLLMTFATIFVEVPRTPSGSFWHRSTFWKAPGHSVTGWYSEFYFVTMVAHFQKGRKFHLWFELTAFMSLLLVRFAVLPIYSLSLNEFWRHWLAPLIAPYFTGRFLCSLACDFSPTTPPFSRFRPQGYVLTY